jgi:tRNA modification GTPase
MERSGPHHTIETPRSSIGAIAIIRVVHPDPTQLGLTNLRDGQVRLAKFWDIDEGVLVRWDPDSIMLMPHGGIAIVRAISQKLANLGVPLAEFADPCAVYPEAETEIEAYMLAALARAPSPQAVDILLEQPRRWRALGIETIECANAVIDFSAESELTRLIEPVIVAAVGRANVGKSTLINALVGEHVAIVADLAGTTRDHVGVLVDLGGLVVRWIDTPGIDERVEDGDEIDLALGVVRRADLIVHCVDSNDIDARLDERLSDAVHRDAQLVVVGTRADLGEHQSGVDLRISINADGSMLGIESLVERIRECLVPESTMSDPRPWRFWEQI